MSSSSAACPCVLSLNLIPAVVNAGCGIEVTNGVAYSIGSQQITYTNLQDNCSCFRGILINGNPNLPVCIEDGQVISVTIVLNTSCGICTSSLFCNNLAFFKFIKPKKINLKIKRAEMIKDIENRKKNISKRFVF